MENTKEIKVSTKTNIENVIYTCIKFLEKKKGIVKLYAIGNARKNLKEIVDKILIKRSNIYKYVYCRSNHEGIILTPETKIEIPKYKLIENKNTNIKKNENEIENINTIEFKENLKKDEHLINKLNKDEIIIRYKKNFPLLKLFDSEFVKNNKNHCKMILDNIEQDLVDTLQFHIGYNYNYMYNNLIEIKLKGMENITDMSYMFYKCSNLLSVSNISNLDTSKVKNMKYTRYFKI